MPSVAKISVSLSPDDLAWAKSRAKRQAKSLSSVVTDALQQQRQAEARRALLHELGGDDISEAEVEAVRREMAGETPRASTRRPRKSKR